MQIRISKKNVAVTLLCWYFLSKLLWDKISFGLLEIISLVVLGYAIVKYFMAEIKKDNLHIAIIFVFYSLYIVIDSLIKNTFVYTSRAMYEYVFYSAMVFGLSYFLSRCNIERLVKAIFTLGLIIVTLSWYEYLTKQYIIGSFLNTIKFQGQAYGFRAAVFTRSFLSHGVILGFIALCAFDLYLRTNKKIYFLSAVFCWITILTTGSRGPLVSTFVALIVVYIMNNYRISKRIDRKVLIWSSIGLLLLLAVWFFYSSFTTGITSLDYFIFRIRKIADWSTDAANLGRVSIWKNAIDWFKKEILFGIGPSTTGSWGTASRGVTESGVLKRLCELGIVGFGLYIAFIVSIIKFGSKRYKMLGTNKKSEYILFFGIIVLILINDITLQSTEEIMVSFIYSFGLGGLLSCDIIK